MKRLSFYLICFFLVVGNGACKKKKLEINNKAGELPLLTNTNTIGMIVGFNADNPPATQDSINTAWQEALDAGMNGARLQVDWPDIELSEGVYDQAFLEDRLSEMSANGLKTHLLISAYDSGGPDVPDYLEGEDFDGDRMIDRYKKLMDWVIPLLAAHNGYAISICNEPDNEFAEKKNLCKTIINFVKPVRDHIHGINENIGVSVTMNVGNFAHSEKKMQKLMFELDYGCFNIYGSGSELTHSFSKAEIEDEIQHMLDFAGSKNIVIQELGMHSDSELLNSSETIQKNFFNTFFNVMENEPRIKAAYIFQLVDWSPSTIDVLNSAFGADTPQWFIDQYGRVLETIGLMDYDTGNRRPAFAEVINWIEKFN